MSRVSYQNDVDRLGERVRLILNSFTGAPDVDQDMLYRAAGLLGAGFAALDEAISGE